MRNRKSAVGRRARRQRFLLQLLASMTVSVGTSAWGVETEHAYFADHPSATNGNARTLLLEDPALQQSPSILLVQAQEPNDDVPSSSDAPDDPNVIFIDPPMPDSEANFSDPQMSLGAPVFSDIDAVVDQAQLPAPVIEPSYAAPADVFMEPMMAPTRSPLGAVAGSYSAAPNMMGDFFGGTFSIGSALARTVALAGGDRRYKIAENTSPMPQDRVFFNYNHFHNALRDVNDVTRNLDRFVFGMEKTFMGGMASLESRVPFASALDSTQAFGVPDTVSTELGNASTTLKVKLLSGCDWLISGGATLTLPTGDDFLLFNGSTPQLLIENDAVHLAPFLGFLKVPNRCWFAQGFIQADFDLNGNEVFTANGFEGELQDQNVLFIDASIGRWIHRSCNPCDRLSGVAAIFELHYTTTMNDTDSVAGVDNPFNRMDLLNITAGLNFQFQKTSLRVGAAAPLRDDEEHLFDTEILVQLNRNF